MSKLVIKNTTYIFAARAGNAALLFSLFVVLSRKLGVETLGTYSFLHTVILTSTFFAGFGLDILMVREVAKDNNSGGLCLSNILGLKTLTSLITVVVIVLSISLFIPDVNTRRLLWIYSSAILFNSLSQTLWHYGDSFEKLQYHSILWVISNILKASLGIGAAFYYGRIDFVIYGMVLSEFVAFIASLLIIWKYFGVLSFKFDFQFYRKLIKKSYIIGIGVILGALYFRVDIVMLGLMKNQEYVGWYSVSCKIIEGFTILPGSIILASFPALSRNYEVEKSLYWQNVKRALSFLFLLGISVSTAMALFADKIIVMLYGAEYVMSAPVLRLLSIVLLLVFINWFLSYVLISSGKEKFNTICLVVATIVNIAANYALIPGYAHIGAAIATIISEVVLIGILTVKVLKIRTHLLAVEEEPVLC